MLLKKVTLLPIELHITTFKFQGIIHTIWSEQKGKPFVFSEELEQGASWVKKGKSYAVDEDGFWWLTYVNIYSFSRCCALKFTKRCATF